MNQDYTDRTATLIRHCSFKTIIEVRVDGLNNVPGQPKKQNTVYPKIY